MIRTLTRAAAALPLGAFALGMLPFGTTHAAQDYSADWGMSASCSPGYQWLLSITNEGVTEFDVVFAVDGGASESFTLGLSENKQIGVPSTEGLASTVRLSINGTEVDSESTSAAVDCLTDGEPYATISIVCPEPGSNQDIFVDYELGIENAATKFGWKTPDNGENSVTIANWVDHITYKVEQGQTIDVWVWDVNDGNKVLASLIDTVDCPVQAEEVPGDDNSNDNSADSEGSAGSLPDTGSETTLAWLAAAATLLGAGAVRLSRRR